jgi:tetratricopeptide (TPR) repeat protein
MIGLAGACKYVPLVLGMFLPLAYGLGRRKSRERGTRSLLTSPALWAGVAAIPIALFVGSPFLFIDWKQTLVDITAQRRSLFSEWVGQSVFPLSLPSYLAGSIPHAMGWVAYLLALAGLVLLWRTGRAGRLLVLIPTLIVLANGLLRVAQERYVLPALPFLYLGTSLAIVRAAGWAHARLLPKIRAGAGGLSPALLAGLLTVAAIAWPFQELLATRHSLGLPDSRHLSRRWIQEHVPRDARMALELYGPVFDDAERAFVVWPFFATHSLVGSPAYHPEFLDGFEYHVASSEISRRFESEPARHPVEVGYYRWLQDHAGVVWESDVKTTSGPRIVIRRLSPGISTRERRDSVFAAAMPKPSELDRIELWCVDCSRLFARFGDYARSEEWARRGLRVGVTSMEPQLRAGLAMALWYQGQLDSADQEIRAAIGKAPREPTFRAVHGAILLEMTRSDEALAELRKAIELDPTHPQAAAVREQIAHIEAARKPR